MMDTDDDILEQIVALFAADAEGTGEISLAAHMLQSAAAASAAGADEPLIAAALLHDIGHWLHRQPIRGRPFSNREQAVCATQPNSSDLTLIDVEGERPLDAGDDNNHGTTAARYLAPHFDDTVTQPIALHVAAKRYLCATEPDYHQRLSPGSVQSLERQGGPMSQVQAAEFESTSGYERAVALRRWDEYGKMPGLEVPGIVYYRPLLRRLIARGARSG